MPSQSFPAVSFYGSPWDLSHLDSFAFKADIGFEVTVVVIFSSHCFTHSFKWDARPVSEIPHHEIYDYGGEKRVLNPIRYALSQTQLRPIINELSQRRIIVANDQSQNFMCWEIVDRSDIPHTYAVFFEVGRDEQRRGRLLMRVQSAYPLEDGLTKRQKQAKKVNLNVLLKAAYEGRRIRS